MANSFVINTGATTLVAATTKTVLQLPTTSTAGVTVIGIELCFSRSVFTTTSASVAWNTYTTGGTGTAKSAQKWGVGQGVSPDVGTLLTQITVEPTGLSAAGLPSWRIPLPGMYSVLFPSGREFYIPPSSQWCLRISQQVVSGTPAPQNEVRVNVYFEQ